MHQRRRNKGEREIKQHAVAAYDRSKSFKKKINKYK